MNHQGRNIFLAFSGGDKEENRRKNTMGKKTDHVRNDTRAKSQSSDDSNEPGLRRSNRSNKGIAREMFDPSHVPSHSRKSLPAPTRPEQDDTPDRPNSPNNKVPAPRTEKEVKPESSEESESESENENCNDPEKLWCICRKPHSGRFMISCDVCEEWFHGDCVGITVQRGKQMEKKGEEYVCPACINKTKKQKSEKKEKLEKTVKQKSGVKLKGYAHSNAQPNDDTKTDKPEEKAAKPRICIVSSCNNPAQPDSIYCSNVCILRHAKESLGGLDKVSKSTDIEKPKNKVETKDERIVRKIKEASSRGKVAVMCMKTGKIFANASAPLKSELESFLQKNPTFQRLKIPKTYKQKLIAKERQKKELQKPKPSKNPAPSDTPKDLVAAPGKYSDDPDYNPEEKHFANPYKQYTPVSPRNEHKDKAKKHKLSHNDSGDAKKMKHKSHDHDRRASLEKGASKMAARRDSRNHSDEKFIPKKNHKENEVRKNVQKTLQGILESRSNNSEDLKMHPASINKLVSKIEDSLHKLFGGVNSKYKNRYRSIMFNLKDEKNQGLWRKVILGEVTSASLVKMTAEEMASKELAQWRKHELKQELEMIKELEVANQATRPIAKITHKGEIAINEDYSDLTESHLNYDNEKSGPTVAPHRIRRNSANQHESTTEINQVPSDTTSQHSNHLFDLNCMICTGQIKEEKANVDDSGHKSVKRSTSIILSNEAQAPAERETDEEIIKKITAFSQKRDSLSEPLEQEESQLDPDNDESSNTPEEEDSTSAAIAMPEPAKRSFRKPSWENFLWAGTITMPELSNFRSNAYAASGNSKELVNCIPQKLAMDGRIHPKVVWEYLARVRDFSNKEVCVIQFHAAGEEDRAGYVGMLSYFSSRKRFGVVSNQNTQFVKDIYVAPLLENEDVPRQLLPLRGPGIPSEHPSMLIGIIVRCVTETKRPIVDIDRSFARISGLDSSNKKHKLATDFDFTSKVPKLSEDNEDEPYSPMDVIKDEDDEEYNPETANFGNILDGDETDIPPPPPPLPDDDEAYDPEKVIFDDSSRQNEDDAPYDPEEDVERLESSEVKALQEKQAFLEKMKHELEMKKAELAKEEMSLQIQQIAPNPPAKPKKTVSQTQVDPRVAARMRNKIPTTTSSATDNPLQTIYSVLNIDRTGNA